MNFVWKFLTLFNKQFEQNEQRALFLLNIDINGGGLAACFILEISDSVVKLLARYTQSRRSDAENAPEEVIHRDVRENVGEGAEDEENGDGTGAEAGQLTELSVLYVRKIGGTVAQSDRDDQNQDR